MSKRVQLEYRAGPARDYIVSFMPGIHAPQLPFTLNLRLGGATQVDIVLVIVERKVRGVVDRLRQGFGEIRRGSRDGVPANWPSESHILRIAAAVSGHAEIASDIPRLIGDDQYGNPDERLKLFMNHLDGGMNLSRPVDIDYYQILSRVPADVLPTTLRILGFLIFHHPNKLSVDDDAKFLNIDRVTFRQSLQNLHSVISIPPVEKSNTTPLRVCNASFSDFLKDPNRSGRFYLNEQAVKYDFILQYLHWIEDDDGPPFIEILVGCLVGDVWDCCCELSDDIVGRLESFNFSCMTSAHIGWLCYFGSFLQRLHSLGSVRSKSLITVIREHTQEHPSISKWIQLEYETCDPRKYIASFIPDVGTPKFPFILNLRLGKAAYAYISLKVIEW
ncbi:hypothetical protein P691DRAFT_779175 [Macrolepiota fuliginosa MF-IS2]|uniref:Uncharacterized protein n=1 Tax=Macrolepiota fuliginosa MF-IS2 TaxID=1400762 RepID=A0A9P5X2K9_9AGAR|nr:hypothetical protein P691DRAFT_779175 [Macrolepiota fuliginosa MF-IS2]